jgi:hypothetical protein
MTPRPRRVAVALAVSLLTTAASLLTTMVGLGAAGPGSNTLGVP